MYCDDSSVKPVESKQVVVRFNLLIFLVSFFSNHENSTNYRAKRHMFCSTKESDLRLYRLVIIEYSSLSALSNLLSHLLVVAIICILAFALSL